jgi:NADP-dependent 3-hydroxy acid dehydrogenase YdfG
MAINLKDKVVLITGASSGFGEDAARLFAAEGAAVVLAARRIERMQAQVERIQKAGGQAMATPVDVTNKADIENMVKSVIESYGQIDILFNNAGFGRLDWFENLNPARDIETQIAVNLTGLIEVTHAVLPHMLARGSGQIINMSSVAGWLAAPTHSVYAATKFGVRGFNDTLRREVRHRGIRVSAIYPGPATTEFGEHTGHNSMKSSLKIPGSLNMTSEYVARQVVAVAKRPRRALILPWWFVPVIWFDRALPAVSDWIQMRVAKKFH